MAYARPYSQQSDVALPSSKSRSPGRGRIRRVHRMSLQTLARLGMDQSVLHGIQRRVDHEQETDAQAEAGTDTAAAAEGEGGAAVPKPAAGLGPIRPLHSKNYRFPVGRGVGMHHLRN